MIEDWIDRIQDVWGGISGNGFNSVRAPYLIKKAEYPSSIDPAKLAAEPIALTMISDTKFEYSSGGPNIGFYRGITEFHVAPSLDRTLLPSLLQWPRLIVVKAAANLKLGLSTIDHFILQEREDQISGPLALQYGDESEHWGFIVYWEVKENVNAAVTVAAGD